MKRKVTILAISILVGMISLLLVPSHSDAAATRGVWISCFDYDTAGLKDKTEVEFRKNVKTMFAKVKAEGCNTVFFHVRAFDDAIWPSTNFSVSKYMSSSGILSYDPMKILVTEAHAKGLKFHAWMNPYRVNYSKILDPSKQASIDRVLLAVK